MQLGNNPLTLVNTANFQAKEGSKVLTMMSFFVCVGPPNKLGTTQEVNVWEQKGTRRRRRKPRRGGAESMNRQVGRWVGRWVGREVGRQIGGMRVIRRANNNNNNLAQTLFTPPCPLSLVPLQLSQWDPEMNEISSPINFY